MERHGSLPKLGFLGKFAMWLLPCSILLAVLNFPFESGRGRSPRAASVIEATKVLAAQADGQQAPIRVRTALVQVDAFVTDKGGKRILNLNASNFQISEDNRVQRLTSVDYFDVGAQKFTENAEAIYVSLGRENDARTLRQIGHDHRLIVLFFDKTAMFPEDLARSVTAAQEFVRDQMTPADLVAIVSYAMELNIAEGFTNDRQELSKALNGLLPANNSSANGPKQELTTAASLQVAPNDAGMSLRATAALGEMLAQIPGRKSVVHFTGGLTLKGEDSIDDAAELTASMQAANDHNASLYEVDSRGLMTLCVKSPGPPIPDFPCNCIDQPDECLPVHPSRTTLRTLAANTGGVAFTDREDFRAIFQEVQDESTGYYMLSYESLNQKNDGKYRHISIKVVGVPGAQIKYRPGYVAPLEAASPKK